MATHLEIPSIKPGMSIKVKLVNPSSGRFCINLCDPDDTIVLHVNPRFTGHDANRLILNTRELGKWGHEERPSGFDFHPKIRATIEIEAKADGYDIFSNGRFLHKYAHRVPLDRVVKIEFHPQDSDVLLESITVCYDKCGHTHLGISSINSGMSIKVKLVNPSSGRFCINLCDPDDIIVLHVNPRFTGHDANQLILNTCQHGRWGREERPSGFDFHPKIKATVEIEAKLCGYNISSNGRFLHKYAHRMPLNRVVKTEFSPQDSDALLESITVCYNKYNQSDPSCCVLA